LSTDFGIKNERHDCKIGTEGRNLGRGEGDVGNGVEVIDDGL
jgi:hypothetical protein